MGLEMSYDRCPLGVHVVRPVQCNCHHSFDDCVHVMACIAFLTQMVSCCRDCEDGVVSLNALSVQLSLFNGPPTGAQ